MTINSAICNQKENHDIEKRKEIQTRGFPRGKLWETFVFFPLKDF